MSLNSIWNLSRNDDVAIGWSRSNFYAIFSVNRYAYCVWLLHKYEAHMKGLPICFSEVQVKNDVTDNNNKHLVTAFEGECRNIIELREHLKLCFLIILIMIIIMIIIMMLFPLHFIGINVSLFACCLLYKVLISYSIFCLFNHFLKKKL